MPSGTRKPPWYRQTEVLDRACAYVGAYLTLLSNEEHGPRLAQVDSYGLDALTRLIFESNTFEGAGLSEAGTRDALAELGGAIERKTPWGSVELMLLEITQLRRAVDQNFAVKFRGRSREAREVAQHYRAWLDILDAAIRHACDIRGIDVEALDRKQAALLAHESGTPVDEVLAFFAKRDSRFFLAADRLRAVHAILADGLLPSGVTVVAGDYRIGHVVAGMATGFVAPQLVPAAMDELESDARRAFARPLTAREPLAFEFAARFSHRITAIHPFPDFNGRLSRLVLSACMRLAGVPFPVSLKFDKKGRERYLESLHKADKGDLRRFTMLIAKAVVDGFKDIDAKLELAGLARLLPP